MPCVTYNDLAQQHIAEAKALGAVTQLTYHSQIRAWPEMYKRVKWSEHFFDANGNEIAYFIWDLLPGLRVLDTPRKWAPEFLHSADCEFTFL